MRGVEREREREKTWAARTLASLQRQRVLPTSHSVSVCFLKGCSNGPIAGTVVQHVSV